MAQLPGSSPNLIVVGGRPSEIAEFQRQSQALGLGGRVAFTGFQKDVRSYFWAGDLFVFLSVYETFALVVMQAMASGMPAVTTRLHGVEEYAGPGENAWIVEREVGASGMPSNRTWVTRPACARPPSRPAGRLRPMTAPAVMERWRKPMVTHLA
jgi:UDP-glucose:(heptosyl)LPS alpha-1,3-glucosyltransferase